MQWTPLNPGDYVKIKPGMLLMTHHRKPTMVIESFTPGDLFVKRQEVSILMEAFTHETVGSKWWRLLGRDGKVTEMPEAMIKYSIDAGTGRLINEAR